MLLVLDVIMVNMSSLKRQENQGTEKLDNLPSVTQGKAVEQRYHTAHSPRNMLDLKAKQKMKPAP